MSYAIYHASSSSSSSEIDKHMSWSPGQCEIQLGKFTWYCTSGRYTRTQSPPPLATLRPKYELRHTVCICGCM